MGLFSSKTYVVANAATSTLLEDFPEDRYLDTLLSTIKKKEDVTEHLIFYHTTGFDTRLDRFYNYGRTEFTNGLPSTNFYSEDFNKNEITAVLNGIEGATVIVTQNFFEPHDVTSWGMMWLYDNEPNFDYNANTYLVPYIGPNNQLDTVWTLGNFSKTSTGIRVELIKGNLRSFYDITTTIPTQPYYIVEYAIGTSKDVRKLWTYDPATSVHPTLNTNTISSSSQFFPIIPIRYNDRNINSVDNELTRTTRNLFRNVNFDLDDLTKGLTTTKDKNGNDVGIENLDKISDIFFLYGVNVYSDNEIEIEVLFELFESMSSNNSVDKSYFDAARAAESGPIQKNNLFIQSGNFDFNIFNYYVDITNVVGTIGKVGTYKSFIDYQGTSTFSYLDGGEDDTGPTTSNYSVDESSLILRHQFSINNYQEIKIKGLEIHHTINTVRGGRQVKFKLEAHTVGGEITDEKENFILPIALDFLDTLTTRKADKYLSVTARIVFYASDSKKVSAFKNFLGTFLGPILTFLAIASLLIDPTTTLGDFLLALGKLLIYKYALGAILAEIFKNNPDNEIVQIAAVAVSIWISYEYLTFGATDLAPADILLASTQALSMTATPYFDFKANQLELAGVEHESQMDDLEKELEEAQQFLEVRSILDPHTLMATEQQLAYEYPTEFYARTLNTAPGQFTFDQLHNYVDNSLDLTMLRNKVY